MENSHFEKSFEVSSLYTDFKRSLSLHSLLTLIQETSSLHAGNLGWGHQEMLARRTFWVLSRQKVVMRSWPKLRDTITIKTWLRLEESVASIRDFSIHLNGVQIGESTTTWATLSTDTRRPVIMDRSEVLGQLTYVVPLDFTATKIFPRKNLTSVAQFTVRNSDLDHNMHVNNTRYFLWVLDSIPMEELQQLRITSYEINFLSEARLGDVIEIQHSPTDGYYQGVRAADQKIIYTVLLQKS